LKLGVELTQGYISREKQCWYSPFTDVYIVIGRIP